MNTAWDAILSHLAARLHEESGVDVLIEDLVAPPKPEMGDIAYGCFNIAKAQKKNPAVVAEELAKKISKDDHIIQSASAAGPYVNVTLRAGEFVERVVTDIEQLQEDFGTSDDGKRRTVMLEYAQPNTHKEIHVGHLRNFVLGASLVALLNKNGWRTVPVTYHGDVGAHVSKCLWLLVREAASSLPQPKPKRKKKGEPPHEPMSAHAWVDHVVLQLTEEMATEILNRMPKEDRAGRTLGRIYAESTKLLEENPDWKDQVSHVQQRLEAQDRAWMVLWKATRHWSIVEMNHVFQDLGVSAVRQYFESEVVDAGQKIVDELLKKEIAHQSQGAIVVDLEDQKLGVFLVRKSDGTSLYATKDLALAVLKHKEYPKMERSLLLVDNRQTLYFQQLFATLKLMGLKQQMEFIGYEFVTLKSGAMSSREGTVVTWEHFRDEAVKYARAETIARHEDWSEGQVQHTAWALAMGGIKFSMLKQDGDKVIVFDMEKALSFDGDTGPYIQYAATRLSSILKKAGSVATERGDLSALTEPTEKQLALHLASYPAACRKAAQELRPMVVAQWCLGLASRISALYHDVKVLESPDGVLQARLRLVRATHAVLQDALSLLGIPLPDEM